MGLTMLPTPHLTKVCILWLSDMLVRSHLKGKAKDNQAITNYYYTIKPYSHENKVAKGTHWILLHLYNIVNHHK